MANEKRLIDAKKLPYTIAVDDNGRQIFYVRAEDIDKAPTVEAVEVVHGRWLYDSGSGKYFCSVCDENAVSFKKDTLYGGDLYEVCLSDYCPSCGAKMRGGNE